ncbi:MULTISPECIES: PAS domain-containing protein [unclassified Duganella]|uniref:PAS domain-containing protein n=1 Tax=unclassified Duganella TaxID=2636909 RepID=UPI000884BB72|nr:MULTISPECIES: PAS domain-containing protein [unclassified Duganella]SDG53084.1 PAS domain S-box-containing protein [Duganella sp. OV458]SDJ75911.1 PAS domain S-box-containing protein [Duganella sp. OV510]
MNQNDDDTDWMIEDEAQPAGEARPDGASAASAPPPWRVLIVDDDVDVHVVTKFSLSNACFQGRRLSFLHAYSGEEALNVLRNTPDIALVLLDVIMETSDAGLHVARQIRDTLHNNLVRIVLRTGQPGQALEHSIILDYDINDFWCKTDLTTRKLFTTVISSLRAYAGLEEAYQHTVALQSELDAARKLLAAVDQHAVIATLDAHGRFAAVNDKFCTVFQFSREELLEADPRLLHAPPYPADQLVDALKALNEGEAWTDVITTWRRDGQEVRLRITATPDDGGTIIVGSVLQALKKPL